MSSRLEQAMKRLDAVVSRLEKWPPSSPAAADAPAASDPALKAEIAEIRALVDQAMTALDATSSESGA